MKNYYELLGVSPAAAADEIKRAFRHEIARYHPDKVQHLGPEFQEIASARAADLTEAYRVLMDDAARKRYDEQIAGLDERAKTAPGSPRPAPARAEPWEHPNAAHGEPAPDRRFDKDRASTAELLRKAIFAKLSEAVAAVANGAATMSTAPGVDAVYAIKGKSGFFKKAEPTLRVMAKYVPHVDGGAVAESWPAVATAARHGETVCLLLLGAGLAPCRELASAVADQRRRSRAAAPIVVPVDVRDWDALFPPDAPAPVRAIIQQLRHGQA